MAPVLERGQKTKEVYLPKGAVWKNIWTGELGKKAADLESINLYLKPEENAAYYVINESFTGRIEF